MPYKVEGKIVYVQKDGKWKRLKRHKSHEDALRHLRALLANVEDTPKAAQDLIAVFEEIRDTAFEQSLVERLAALRGSGPGRRPAWEDFVNDYQRELASIYDDWARDLASRLDGVEDEYQQRMIIDAALVDLEAMIILSSRDALFMGYSIGLTGLEYDRGRLGSVGFLMTQNEDFIRNSLIPDLRRGIFSALSKPEFVISLAAILAVLVSFGSRVEMYAGAAWSAIMVAVGEVARDNLEAGHGRVRWVLERLAQHCATCLRFGDKTYDSYDLMLQETGGVLPAMGTECRTNCRCHLQLENTKGEFSRPL